MKTIGAYEAKTHLLKLLDEVAAGEQITITKHGHPIAMLTPLPNKKSADVSSTIQALRALRQEMSLGGLSVREMIEEGRRF